MGELVAQDTAETRPRHGLSTDRKRNEEEMERNQGRWVSKKKKREREKKKIFIFFFLSFFPPCFFFSLW